MFDVVDSWAKANGFGPRQAVPQVGRLSALTTGRSRRCGVYLLHLEGGDVYVGRSLDVLDRLGQHRVERHDLREVQLRWCARAEVNALERELIRSAELAGLPLRNIVEMSVVRGDQPLDLVVPIELQQAWLTAPRKVNAQDPSHRADFTEDQRRPFRDRYQRFTALPGAEVASQILRSYVNGCLLLPKRTERDYWSLSCLPGATATTTPRLVCVSVGRMETLVLTPRGGFVVVAKDEFTPAAARLHRRVLRASDYAAAGEHQAVLEAGSLADLAKLLKDDDVIRAAGVLTYRVMRKQQAWYARYHSPWLGDEIL